MSVMGALLKCPLNLEPTYPLGGKRLTFGRLGDGVPDELSLNLVTFPLGRLAAIPFGPPA